jgi:hypothetical protein
MCGGSTWSAPKRFAIVLDTLASRYAERVESASADHFLVRLAPPPSPMHELVKMSCRGFSMSRTSFVRPADYVLGLDLGQQLEFTALAILERTCVTAEDQRPQVHLAVRHLERWPLQTAYPKIIADLAARLAKLSGQRPLIAVDRTGVGAAVANMVRDAHLPARPLHVLITSGHSVSHPDGCTHVPKKELASVLQVLLQTGRRF